MGEDAFFTPEPYPSSPHAMVVFNAPDVVGLNPGEAVDRAQVRGNGRFGGGRVDFIGTGDTRTILVPQGPGGWRLLEASGTEFGTQGRPLGAIVEIRLNGGEILYDDLEIHIRPPQ